MTEHISAPRFFSLINASSCGAVADGVADDTAALQLAIDSALAFRVGVRLGPGTYKICKYLDVNGARSLKIIGDGATIRFPSDHIGLPKDTVATSIAMARSAILLRHCTDVSIEGMTFVGGSAQNLTKINQGGAIYATYCVGTRVTNCTMIDGFSPFFQDSQPDTEGIGKSLGIEDGAFTLTSVGDQFVTGHDGQLITISGCQHSPNNGSFRIASYVSAKKVTFDNPNGFAETSPFRWTIADADRDTRIEACRIETRGYMAVGSDSAVERCHFERPTGGNDATGIGDTLVFEPVSSRVKLTDASAQFLPQHDGKYITIAGAHFAANDGTFKLTYIAPAQVSWENVSGRPEQFAGTWWIMGGDTTGIGAGTGALMRAGDTVTLTSAQDSFSPGDEGKLIRIHGATTQAHDGGFVLTFLSSNQVSWRNPASAFPPGALLVEDFAGKWAIDSYDFGKKDGDTHGSSHGIYLFAGRHNVLIQGCTFKGIRTTAVKVSGSLEPIRNVAVMGNYARDCGAFFIGGADDNQEHTGLTVSNNHIVDCGTGREGWNEGGAITFLGSRNSSATENVIHYTRNAFGSVDGQGVAGGSAITASRYVEGKSQPIEDITIAGNTITADPSSTFPRSLLGTAIALHGVGQLSKFGNVASLMPTADPASVQSPDGVLITLEADHALFSSQDVGKPLTLVDSVNFDGDGPFTIESVPKATMLTFRVVSLTSGAPTARAYRISPRADERGGACLVADNQILNVGTGGIRCEHNVGTELRGNVFSGLLSNIACFGDASPRIVGNREMGTGTQNARLTLNVGVSWPYVDDNLVTNQAIGSTSSRGWGVAVIGSTAVDYPLLGKRGRTRPSCGREEVVVAYGSLHVDGDTITVVEATGQSGTTYTYKGNAPNTLDLEFNSFDGLVQLISEQTGIECTDYGSGFHNSNLGNADVTTQHLRIRKRVPSVGSDGSLHVRASALNPTALVLLRNQGGLNLQCDSRGSDSTGSTADKTVVWSPACATEGGVILWPDNAAAQALLQAHLYRPIKNIDGHDSGCCEVLTHGTSHGSEEFRWALA